MVSYSGFGQVAIKMQLPGIMNLAAVGRLYELGGFTGQLWLQVPVSEPLKDPLSKALVLAVG